MKFNRLLLVFLAYSAFFVFQFLFVFLSTFFFEESPSIYFFYFISALAYFIIVFILIRLMKLKISKRFNLNARLLILLSLISIIFIVIQPITVPLNFIENLNVGLLTTTSFKSFYNLLSIDFFYYFVVVVVANPILEELFFRKIMLTEVKKKFGAFWAVLVSSLLFSVGHLEINQMQSAFIIGIVFGYLYLKTNNLTITIVLHMLFNLGVYITIDSTVILSSQYYYLLLYPVLAIVLYYLIKQIVKASPSER